MSATASRKDGAKGMWGLMAEFDSPAAIMHAAEKVCAAGYRKWDCHTPFPVHGLDKAMGVKTTILPVLVFFGGLIGCTLGLILQWFANASAFDMWFIVAVRGYDFLISGKPLISGPAWIPVIFEVTVLFAALSVVLWMLLLNRLPSLYHPTFKSHRFTRVTDDRFFVVIEAGDPKFEPGRTQEFLEGLNPLSVEVLED
ncbi:MAG: DUF3341 domain-containing protein [Phycisphaerales bacterium]|nr:MAG: DUF3341 domain-containing protein [Phycisphaerales bacterium]